MFHPLEEPEVVQSNIEQLMKYFHDKTALFLKTNHNAGSCYLL